jgi:hypothetical protein
MHHAILVYALSACEPAEAPGPVSPERPAPGSPQPQPAPDDPAPSMAPTLELAEPTLLPVTTTAGLPLVQGFSVNTRIHPHGLPTRWHVEYGPDLSRASQVLRRNRAKRDLRQRVASEAGHTSRASQVLRRNLAAPQPARPLAPDEISASGWRAKAGNFALSTPERALPGRLLAHFAEDWAGGKNGWNAGLRSVLEHHPEGGPEGSAFVRYTDDGQPGNDTNHYEGIGLIHLGPYAYLGNYVWAEVPPLYLGGGFPDLRGAHLSLWLRGVGWDPRGTELGTWIQSYRDPSVVEVLPYDSRYPNWAHTASPLTSHLVSGEWEPAEWVLRNRTQDWTFAGSYGGRLLYDYGELESALSAVNVDLFVWQILFCDLNDLPTGTIDTAQLHLVYRQRSVCAPSNGGTLIEGPGGTGADLLTDGWRHGEGHEWHSDPDPQGPAAFVYGFDSPITLSSVTVTNSVAHPSRDLRVSVSEDGGKSWVVVAEGALPEQPELGPNHGLWHVDRWELQDEIAVWAPLHPAPIDRLQVEVLSGYDPARWGLGEIEAFGTGAQEQTDDDWYDANVDVLVGPGTWSFRVVADSEAGRTVGAEQVVTVP